MSGTLIFNSALSSELTGQSRDVLLEMGLSVGRLSPPGVLNLRFSTSSSLRLLLKLAYFSPFSHNLVYHQNYSALHRFILILSELVSSAAVVCLYAYGFSTVVFMQEIQYSPTQIRSIHSAGCMWFWLAK